jgi:hypothetical protein
MATIELVMALMFESDLLASPDENEHEDEKADGERNKKQVLHKWLGQKVRRKSIARVN